MCMTTQAPGGPTLLLATANPWQYGAATMAASIMASINARNSLQPNATLLIASRLLMLLT